MVKQPAVLIGHSMGALLSLSLAKKYPELCLAIVPINAIYKRSEEAKKSVLQRALELKNMSHVDACAPVKRWFSDLTSTQDQRYAELCSNWLSDTNLEMPILYITGEQDANSSVDMTKAMAMVTPKSEYVIVEQSRHMTPLTHASMVNAALKNFLQRRLVNVNTSVLD